MPTSACCCGNWKRRNARFGGDLRPDDRTDARVKRHDRHGRALAIALAIVAGYVDAIGFLGLGGYFVSFMSGNTTRAAVGVVRYAGMATFGFALIASFVAGVVAGSLLAEATDERRKSATLVLAAGILAVAAVIGHFRVAGLVLVPAAMGATNAVFQRDGQVSIGVTYMTGTLVRFGQHVAGALRGGDRLGWLPYLLLWLGLLGGGILGTTLYPFVGVSGLLLAVIAYLGLAWAAPRAVES